MAGPTTQVRLRSPSMSAGCSKSLASAIMWKNIHSSRAEHLEHTSEAWWSSLIHAETNHQQYHRLAFIPRVVLALESAQHITENFHRADNPIYYLGRNADAVTLAGWYAIRPCLGQCTRPDGHFRPYPQSHRSTSRRSACTSPACWDNRNNTFTPFAEWRIPAHLGYGHFTNLGFSVKTWIVLLRLSYPPAPSPSFLNCLFGFGRN